MSFFTDVASALNDQGKRIFIEVVGAGEGRIRTIITPDVGAVPADASPEVAKVYALMARPQLVTGTPEEVEAALGAKLGLVREVLDEGEATLAALRQIKEQAKAQPAGKKDAPQQQEEEAELDEEEDADGGVVDDQPDAGTGKSIGASF